MKSIYDILHLSDIHLGASKHILDQDEYLERAKKGLYQVKDLIVKFKIKVLCITGDIFEKGEPTQSEKDLFAKWLSELDLLGYCKVLIQSGNHDCETSGTTALDTFSYFQTQLKNVEFILNKPRSFWIDGNCISAIPWHMDIIKTSKKLYKNLKKKPKKYIVMGHVCLPGIKSDTGYKIPGSHKKYLKCDYVDAFLFGDIHLRFISNCGKIQMVGAVMQHKWGDTPDKGISLLNFRSITQPKFHKIKVKRFIRTTNIEEAKDSEDVVELISNDVITEDLPDNVTVINYLDDDDVKEYVTNFNMLDGLPEHLKKKGFKTKMINKSLKYMEKLIKN